MANIDGISSDMIFTHRIGTVMYVSIFRRLRDIHRKIIFFDSLSHEISYLLISFTHMVGTRSAAIQYDAPTPTARVLIQGHGRDRAGVISPSQGRAKEM